METGVGLRIMSNSHHAVYEGVDALGLSGLAVQLCLDGCDLGCDLCLVCEYICAGHILTVADSGLAVQPLPGTAYSVPLPGHPRPAYVGRVGVV